VEFILNGQPGQDDIDKVRSKLQEYNMPFFENMKEQAFVLEAKDEAGNMAGGITFGVYGQWLKVDFLWVDENSRRNGLGSELLIKAEETAKSRGCDMAYLTTFSFQARPFYEKHGYRLVYVQKTFPAGIVKYHMEKSLQ
jgi:GNAT superfamily N-acetyltransferase